MAGVMVPAKSMPFLPGVKLVISPGDALERLEVLADLEGDRVRRDALAVFRACNVLQRLRGEVLDEARGLHVLAGIERDGRGFRITLERLRNLEIDADVAARLDGVSCALLGRGRRRVLIGRILRTGLDRETVRFHVVFVEGRARGACHPAFLVDLSSFGWRTGWHSRGDLGEDHANAGLLAQPGVLACLRYCLGDPDRFPFDGRSSGLVRAAVQHLKVGPRVLSADLKLHDVVELTGLAHKLWKARPAARVDPGGFLALVGPA
jgi:hypothetical protein